jgi:hypothetical protein
MRIGQEEIELCYSMTDEVGEEAGLSRPVKRFLADVILGMTKSGNVRLRGCPETRHLSFEKVPFLEF